MKDNLELDNEVSVAREQMEKPNTTTLSKDCITDIEKIKKNPSRYIEINMIREDRTCDNFFIDGNKSSFTYGKEKRKKTYHIDEKNVYLVPLKDGTLLPTIYFYQKNKNNKSIGFENLNKGITGKALSLLYNEKLYLQLFYPEIGKYNFFVVILSIAVLITFTAGIALLYNWYTKGGV